MFPNLIYLILVVLLIAMSPTEKPELAWLASPTWSFVAGMLLYMMVLGLIYLQNRAISWEIRRYKGLLLGIVNIELLVFLAIFQLVMGAPRFFTQFWILTPFHTFTVLFALLLYFGALAWFHFTYTTDPSARSYMLRELRLIIPFVIPFLILSFVVDGFNLVPSNYFQEFRHAQSMWSAFLFLGILIIVLVLSMLLMPFWMQWFWQCQPLAEGPLKQRLEEICRLGHFKHRGLKTWSVQDQQLTAAIVGIAPQFRYVLFTKRLLQEMDPSSVEAVLVHEMGHSYWKHSLKYLLITFGLMILLGIYSENAIPQMDAWMKAQEQDYPGWWWQLLIPIAIFLPLAAIVAFYFRYIFGLFSRLFERQADLYIFKLKMPAQHMIDALNYIGIASGNSHSTPDWHHYSIQERIDFLHSCQQNHRLIAVHHQRVRRYLAAYVLIMSAILFIWGLAIT